MQREDVSTLASLWLTSLLSWSLAAWGSSSKAVEILLEWGLLPCVAWTFQQHLVGCNTPLQRFSTFPGVCLGFFLLGFNKQDWAPLYFVLQVKQPRAFRVKSETAALSKALKVAK